jgi:S-DNA-T family DNA segregation ATPase FtsK/SpoIIIE
MVIATQRPSVDVVTGLIKANFPARIAFAVASSTDSRVILDSSGAERLLGQGDMLFQKPDTPAPLRLQGCFVSDKELSKLVTYWQRARRSATITPDTQAPQTKTPSREQPSPPPPPSEPASSAPSSGGPSPSASEPATGSAAQPAPTPTPKTTKRPSSPKKRNKKEDPAPQPLQQPLWEALQEEAEKPEYSDELMPEAIALVRKLDKASTSLLQRRFRIGYTRAARMIDAMEEMKIIGPPTGTSKAREVYPPPDAQGELAPTGTSDSAGENAEKPENES